MPDTALLALLGSRDESLRAAEEELTADVHVRGNELTLSGEPGDVAFAERVFTELITWPSAASWSARTPCAARCRCSRRRTPPTSGWASPRPRC